MNLYEKFIEAIKPNWEITEPFPSYKDRDENSFRVLHLSQSEFEYLKMYLRDALSATDWWIKNSDATPESIKQSKRHYKKMAEIQRKLKNESRP